MNTGYSSYIVTLAASALALGLSGCSTPSQLTMTDALQKLQDAGEPCLYPLFEGFDSLVESDQTMFCRDIDGGEIGFKMSFYEENLDFEEALTSACEPTGVGPNAKLSSLVLRGENWIATSSEGSKYPLTDLEAILGGSEGKLADLCG